MELSLVVFVFSFLVFFSVHTPPDPFSYYSKLVLINHYICATSLNVPFFLIS